MRQGDIADPKKLPNNTANGWLIDNVLLRSSPPSEPFRFRQFLIAVQYYLRKCYSWVCFFSLYFALLGSKCTGDIIEYGSLEYVWKTITIGIGSKFHLQIFRMATVICMEIYKWFQFSISISSLKLYYLTALSIAEILASVVEGLKWSDSWCPERFRSGTLRINVTSLTVWTHSSGLQAVISFTATYYYYYYYYYYYEHYYYY
jgi:hypothetical protein